MWDCKEPLSKVSPSVPLSNVVHALYIVDPACDVAVYVSPCSLLSVNGDVVASFVVSATLRMSETSP